MPQWSTIIKDTARDDRGDIRRSFNSLANPELGFHGCRTLYECLRLGERMNPMGPCLGYRAISTSGFATPYIYSTYREVVARVNCLAAGLDRLQLVTPKNDEGMTLLGLYLPNCPDWVVSEHAIYALGGATVPFYDTLGPDTVQFILQHTGTRAVVCARRNLPQLCEAKTTGSCPHFAVAILVDGVTPDASRQASSCNLQVISLSKVEAVGSEALSTTGHKHSPPTYDDICTFSYTSGTTGTPKGALLTHGNMVSAMSGFSIYGEMMFSLTDRHLSYLPLPHIFERCVMAQILAAGASAAFFRGDPTLLIEDLQACRPTILPAAPRVLNKIFDKITNGIAAAGGLKKKLFDAALLAKTRGLQDGHLTHAVYDRLLFNKVKKALGMDYVRLLISGSAPLGEKVMTFFRCMLGVPVVEGYGQTEGAASATLSHPDDIATVGHVGGPTASVEIVLIDVPEMGYFHTDSDHRGQPCEGRGEICIRGPSVFKGYYKDPEKTQETIDEEGWLHSGDVGLWRLNGALQIIDRKKNIFKLSQGEYVAPEKIENILMHSPFISQIFVYGDSLQSSLVAIVVPDEEVVVAWAAKTGRKKASFTEHCQSSLLNDVIMLEIRRLSADNGLHGFETAKAIMLESTPFSLENGLLTPTFKLKRKEIREKYENEIASLYSKLPKPLSKL